MSDHPFTLATAAIADASIRLGVPIRTAPVSLVPLTPGVIFHGPARPITHLATTAFSDRPMSAKYGRGIPGMKLLNRGKGKDGIHEFTLNYGAPMGQWTLQEGLDLWKKKHGSDVRTREEIPV